MVSKRRSIIIVVTLVVFTAILFSNSVSAQGIGCQYVQARFGGECKSAPSGCASGYQPPSNCSNFNGNKAGCLTQALCVLITPPPGPPPAGGGGGTGGGAGGGGGSGGGSGGGGGTGGGLAIENPLKAGTIPEILNAIAGFLYTLALAVVTIMVLWGGFQILTAAGNPEGIDRGKRTLLWAVIGTVVILIAGGIADLIADILGT